MKLKDSDVFAVIIFFQLDLGLQVDKKFWLRFMAKKNSFYFGFSPKQVEQLANRLGKPLSRQDIQDLAKNYLIDLIEGKNNLSNKERIEAANVRIKEADATIKESIALHIKTFGKTPSYSANKAIKDKAFRELNSQEVEQISKFIALENTFDGYRITCLKCRLQVEYKNRLEALHEAARHLSGVHGQEILQK